MSSVLNAKLFAPADEVVVYGYGHCGYTMIKKAFENSGVRAYDWVDWGKRNTDIPSRVISYWEFSSGLPINPPLIIGRQCKAGLVNLIITNLFRDERGEPIIPLIFCIDIEQSKYPDLVSRMFSREPGTSAHGNITQKELRIACKMSTEILSEDEELSAKIRAMADRTFKFVKVCPVYTTVPKDCIESDCGIWNLDAPVKLECLPAPWKMMPIKAQHWRDGKKKSPTHDESHPSWKEALNFFPNFLTMMIHGNICKSYGVVNRRDDQTVGGYFLLHLLRENLANKDVVQLLLKNYSIDPQSIEQAFEIACKQRRGDVWAILFWAMSRRSSVGR